MPIFGGQCDQLTNEQIILIVKKQAVIIAEDLNNVNNSI